MNFLYWYLGIGVLVLVSFRLRHQLTRPIEPESKEPANNWRELFKEAVVVVLAVSLFAPFWPVLVILNIRRPLDAAVPTPFIESEFAVVQSDIQTEIDITEIERRERFTDPLGAVPDLPFGHLNGAWKRFREGIQPVDSLWTFVAEYAHWGRVELRKGYVIIRGEEIGPHFLTMVKRLNEQEVSASRAGVIDT